MSAARPNNSLMAVTTMDVASDGLRVGLDRIRQRGAETDLVTVYGCGGDNWRTAGELSSRKYVSPARTIARRREVAERVRETVAALGWTLNEDERDLLERFERGGLS